MPTAGSKTGPGRCSIGASQSTSLRYDALQLELAELIKLVVHGGGDDDDYVGDDDGAGGGDEAEDDDIGGGGGSDKLLGKASCALDAFAHDGNQPWPLWLGRDVPARLGVTRASGYAYAAELSTVRQSEASALSGLSGLGTSGDNPLVSERSGFSGPGSAGAPRPHRPPKDLADQLPP